ncbi:MAG: excisionase family DNA-binding protein [Mesonia sp.]|uniref:excisionase family DNA-binding protein n=1 Tax=Mesonia sp. TaxID=1960830 RepID=UPI003241F0DF
MNKNDFIELSLKAHAIYDANKTCMAVKECAEFLGVHTDTVLRKLHSGDIKGTLIGRVWSIPKIQFLDKILEKWENDLIN